MTILKHDTFNVKHSPDLTCLSDSTANLESSSLKIVPADHHIQNSLHLTSLLELTANLESSSLKLVPADHHTKPS